LLLLDFWPLQRFSLSAFRFPLLSEKIPFFLLTAISCLITFLAQSQNVHGSTAVVSLEFVPLHYRLKNVPVAYVGYLLKLAWPSRLSVFYPLEEIIPAARAAAAVGVLLLVSAVAWWRHRSQPYLAVGWLWFLGTLVPVIGLVQVGGAALADRYSYLPSIGIFIIAAFATRDVAGKFPAATKLFAAAAAVILAGCLFATGRQLPVWQNSETLFRHALAVTAGNDIAHNNLAIALEEQEKLADAAAEYRAAIKISPLRQLLHNNLGSVLDRLGRHTEALAEYREAIRLQPAESDLHANAGHELAALGQFDEALKEFAAAEKLDPRAARTHVETAKVFFQQGRDAGAVDELRAALRLAPDDYHILTEAARHLAANENSDARDGKNALVLALKANEISRRNQPVVYDVLGMALAENGDFTNAQTCAQNALALAAAAKMKGLEPIEQRLELYKKNLPWRESFRATNAPGKP
jgi:tetratricopeptide (TPR) repeat protein